MPLPECGSEIMCSRIGCVPSVGFTVSLFLVECVGVIMGAVWVLKSG